MVNDPVSVPIREGKALTTETTEEHRGLPKSLTAECTEVHRGFPKSLTTEAPEEHRGEPNIFAQPYGVFFIFALQSTVLDLSVAQ